MRQRRSQSILAEVGERCSDTLRLHPYQHGMDMIWFNLRQMIVLIS